MNFFSRKPSHSPAVAPYAQSPILTEVDGETGLILADFDEPDADVKGWFDPAFDRELFHDQ
jgi:hypothetical protein